MFSQRSRSEIVRSFSSNSHGFSFIFFLVLSRFFADLIVVIGALCFIFLKLKKKIKINSEITFVGKGSTFEIWEPKKFEAYMAQAMKDAKAKRNLLKVTK